MFHCFETAKGELQEESSNSKVICVLVNKNHHMDMLHSPDSENNRNVCNSRIVKQGVIRQDTTAVHRHQMHFHC